MQIILQQLFSSSQWRTVSLKWVAYAIHTLLNSYANWVLNAGSLRFGSAFIKAHGSRSASESVSRKREMRPKQQKLRKFVVPKSWVLFLESWRHLVNKHCWNFLNLMFSLIFFAPEKLLIQIWIGTAVNIDILQINLRPILVRINWMQLWSTNLSLRSVRTFLL